MRIKRILFGAGMVLGLLSPISLHAIGTVSGVTANPTSDSQFTVTWTNDVAASEGYLVEASTVPAFDETLYSSSTLDNGATTLAISGLLPNTTYFIRVGALDPGTTNYTASVPPARATLGPQLVGRQFLQTTPQSIKVAWPAVVPGLAVGYLLEVSTASDFTGVLESSGTPGVQVSTLTVSGLLPNTTYYARVATLNWQMMPHWIGVGSSTMTPRAPGPNGLTGVAMTPTTIMWSWDVVPGATGYTLYYATSPTIVQTNIATLVYSESSLVINSSYSRVVTAWSGGVETFASTSIVVYTKANQPAVGSTPFSNVGTSSFTVMWGTTTNPTHTRYEVSVALNNAFTVAVTTPVQFSDNLTANTTNIIGLSPGTLYYVRVRASNGDGFPTNPGPVSSTMTLSTGGSSTGGEGTATIAPSTIQEGGSLHFSTVTFIVPTGGYSTGGGVRVKLPANWYSYLQTNATGSQGYVNVISNPTRAFQVLLSTSEPLVTAMLDSGQSLVAGSTIQVIISNLWPPCPLPGQTAALWPVSSRSGSGGNFAPIASQPSMSYTFGTAKYIWFVPWDTLTVISGQSSSTMTVVGKTNCGNTAPVASDIDLNLNGFLSDFTSTDTAAQFSASSSFGATITSVTIPSGQTQATFFYKTTTLGNNLVIKASFNDIQYGHATYVSKSVNVLNTPVTFTGVSLDSGTAGASTSLTITPNNDGDSDFGFIRFVPSNDNISWRVRISSNNFSTWIYDQWGYGNPYGNLQWNGSNYYGGGANSVVPNGTYTVRIEIPGLIANNSLVITVDGASISGRVRLGSTPMANVWVNANATSGSGGSGAMTNGSGDYTINGLRNGQTYHLYSSFYSTSTQTSVFGNLSNVPAPSTGADITISQPAQIRVAATLSSAASFPMFGNVRVYNANYTQNYNRSIRIETGSTSSDNGDYYNPSTWTIIAVQPGAYTVELNLPGFSPTQQSTTVIAGQTVDMPVFNMTRPANVYGYVILPSTVTNSLWLSVEGIRSGSTHPTVWGGVFLDVAKSSGVYQIWNVPAGNYQFRVRAPGYMPVILSTTVSGSDIGNPTTGGFDFLSSSFNTGGRITGTLTVEGDTSNETNLNLWINAYSPSLGSGEFTQVSLSTHAVTTSRAYQIGGLANGIYQVHPPYLYGYELNPPGPKSVTVASGVGNLDLVLVKNSGEITGSITLPGVNSDYDEVSISLYGPNISTTTIATANTYTIPNLGSGFYSLTAVYATTGAQLRRSVAVVNGQSSDADLDLSAPTYVVTGTVTVQAAFTITPSTGASVTINTISDMLANDTTQYVYINGTSTGLPTARVEAFPKRFDSYGAANRTGFTSNFFAADYKFGSIQDDGSYSIAGLSPGVWELNVYPYLDGGYTPSLAAAKQTVTISNGNKSGVDFGLSAGYSVAGTISLPGGATDDRMFDVLIVTDRGDYVQSSFLHIGTAGSPANSTTFLFKNLPAGRYALMVMDQGSWDSYLMQTTKKYSAKPAAFEIQSSDIPSLNITMARASRVIGKLSIRGKNPDGTPSSTLVTTNNTSLMPTNLRIAARANPWVEGGYREASRNMSSGMGQIDIDANSQFHIDGLVPGVYDVEFRQDSYGTSFSGQGSVNLAYYVQGQVVVTEGQITDLGTVELKQGLSLSGTVQDTNGNYLPNIRVRSEASGKHDHYNNSETFTDAAGQFTLTGLNPDLKAYSITAAPRPHVSDLMAPSAYGQVTKKAVDVTQSPLPTLSFVLETANALLTGQVNTADSLPLGYPDDQMQGFPVAAIYLQRQGVPSSADDPLGDIRGATGLDGHFSMPSLVPGTYDAQIISLNYKPHRFVVTVNAGSNDAGTITLQSGAILNTTITKPDGTAVSENEVEFAVAVTADLGTIIFGQISSDENTRTVRGIRFSGFDSTKRYNVLIFDNLQNITTPNEGRNLTFASDAEEKTLALTYQPSAPTAFVQVRKVGSAAEVTFILSRALRNTLPADNDMSSLLTILDGSGSLSTFSISGDRRSLSVLYTPPVDEQNATLRFSGYTAELDLATGSAFSLTKSIVLRFGQRAAAEQNINPIFGGEVTLAESAGDPSGVNLPANSLLSSDGNTADAESSYGISFTATEDSDDLDLSAPGYRSGARGMRAAALTSQISRGEGAYVSEAYQAMRAAHASVTINPLSSFYSVLLPAGLSHTLNETATLTLQYDSGADPNAINIYFFDGTKYLLESTDRTIDTVNRTISVGVSHFSTFVVLENSLPVIITDGASGSGADIEVFNFPNPFDLSAKTKTLSSKGLGVDMDTRGTIIRYFVPAGKSGGATLDIYNVAGDIVRTISLGSPTVDTYHYVSWDGRNDSGNDVASGVYIGILKVGDSKKTWKMAVIK